MSSSSSGRGVKVKIKSKDNRIAPLPISFENSVNTSGASQVSLLPNPSPSLDQNTTPTELSAVNLPSTQSMPQIPTLFTQMTEDPLQAAMKEIEKLKSEKAFLERRLREEMLKAARSAEAATFIGHESRGNLQTVASSTDELDEVVKMLGSPLSPDTLRKVQDQVRHVSFSLSASAQDGIEANTAFLDWQKFEAGEMPFKVYAINMYQYMLDLEQIMGNRVTGKGLKLKLDIDNKDIWVLSDRSALNRIFKNFISNAINYTDAGGLITFFVKTLSQTSNSYELEMSIRDTGQGMTAAQINTLLEDKSAFTQVHDTQKQDKGGSGAGLKLARKVAETFLHGKYAIHSKVKEAGVTDHGSTFSVTCEFKKPSHQQILEAPQSTGTPNSSNTPIRSTTPIQLEELSPAAITVAPKRPGPSSRATKEPFTRGHENKQQAANAKKAKVLLVDDNAVNLKLVASTLEKLGYSCVTAVNGQQAIDKYLANNLNRLKSPAIAPFDVILMDIQMPVLDGLEATKAIRELEENENSAYPSCPIIALSGNASDEEKNTALAAGMTDYLTKPIKKDVLDAKIKEVTAKAMLSHPPLEEISSPQDDATPPMGQSALAAGPVSLSPNSHQSGDDNSNESQTGSYWDVRSASKSQYTQHGFFDPLQQGQRQLMQMNQSKAAQPNQVEQSTNQQDRIFSRLSNLRDIDRVGMAQRGINSSDSPPLRFFPKQPLTVPNPTSQLHEAKKDGSNNVLSSNNSTLNSHTADGNSTVSVMPPANTPQKPAPRNPCLGSCTIM